MKSVLQEHDAQLIEKYNGLVGLDEVGRGALAGPIYTAACWIKPGFFQHLSNCTETVDMRFKKMTVKKRLEASLRLAQLKEAGQIDYSIASASVEEIDRYNISGATLRAFDRSLQELLTVKGRGRQPLILVDGNPLKAVSLNTDR